MPTEWRPYVRAGILEWNRAFEDAGFRNAIRGARCARGQRLERGGRAVLHRPLDRHQPVVYAIGPSNVDPRTGEILNADILVSASWIQTWRGESARVRGRRPRRCTPSCSRTRSRSARRRDAPLQLRRRMRREGTLTRALARERVSAAASRPQRLSSARRSRRWSCTRSGTRSACATTSAARPAPRAAQLADRELHRGAWPRRVGDGLQPARALARPDDSRATTTPPPSAATTAGRSRYGYADVRPRATPAAPRPRAPDAEAAPGPPTSRSTASGPSRPQAAEPAHLYGTDEDAGFRRARPGSDRVPLRSDRRSAGLGARAGHPDQRPVRFAGDPDGGAGPGLRPAARRLHRSAERPLVRPAGDDQVPRRRDHGSAIIAAIPAPGPPSSTVPAARQRDALAFITEVRLRRAGLPLPARAARAAGPGPLAALGRLTGGGRPRRFPAPRLGLAQQGSLLGQLLDPTVLARIRDAELRATAAKPTVGIPELFDTLTDAIWAEVGYPARTAVRRATSRRSGAIFSGST